LLGRTETPAHVPGYGPIPAALARQLACAAASAGAAGAGDSHDTDVTDATRARAWVRRLLTDPIDGTVTSIDTRRRRFSGALATLIRLRDQVCRDPYCDAPIRDLDHLHDYAQGGSTTAENIARRPGLYDLPGSEGRLAGRSHRHVGVRGRLPAALDGLAARDARLDAGIWLQTSFLL